MAVRLVAMASLMVFKDPWKGNFLGGAGLALATEQLVDLEVVFETACSGIGPAQSFIWLAWCLWEFTVLMAASCHGIHCL